jgi:hypothetical protein
MKKIIPFVCISLIIASCGSTEIPEDKTQLNLHYPHEHVVYLDATPMFAKTSEYVVYLKFNNPIVRVDMKEVVNFQQDSIYPQYRKNLFFDHPLASTVKDTTAFGPDLGNIMVLQYWDSTHVVDDIFNTPVQKITPGRKNAVFKNENNTGELSLPAGTFTDVYGNKSRKIHILYRKKKDKINL